jgi:hypothetical protein
MSESRCAICGGPDVFGLGLCADCSVSDPRADSLVFVRRSARGEDRVTTRERLAELLGGLLDTADGRAAARGERALLRVPADLANHAVHALEQRGVPARTLTRPRAWTAMPSHFILMVSAVTFTGMMAGTQNPALLWISPLFATLLLAVAQRSAAKPLLRPPTESLLPADTESAIRHAFANAEGRPRELLGDLVRMARPLVASLRREGDPAAIAHSLADLITAAAATALEVSRLETTQTTVDDVLASGDAHDVSPDLVAAAQRCGEVATTGTRRLVEAVRAVAEIGGRTAVDAATGSRLSQLTRDLTLDARSREAALRDLDALLAR